MTSKYQFRIAARGVRCGLIFTFIASPTGDCVLTVPRACRSSPNLPRPKFAGKFCAYHYRRKNDIILTLFDGEIMSLDESERNFMATSSITANFAIRDEKEAKAFISAFLSDSRSTVPPARKRNWKLVDSVKEIERRRPRARAK
jgi:hypothetical protein